MCCWRYDVKNENNNFDLVTTIIVIDCCEIDMRVLSHKKKTPRSIFTMYEYDNKLVFETIIEHRCTGNTVRRFIHQKIVNF